MIPAPPIERIGSAGEQSSQRPDEPENRIEQILLDAGDFQQVLSLRAQRPFDIDECGDRQIWGEFPVLHAAPATRSTVLHSTRWPVHRRPDLRRDRTLTAGVVLSSEDARSRDDRLRITARGGRAALDP